MADYIERDAALTAIRERCAPCGEGVEALKSVPAADVAPAAPGAGREAEAICWVQGLNYYIKDGLRREMEAERDG